MTQKALHKFYRDRRGSGRREGVGGGQRGEGVSLHFEDTGSKSPHRSELAAVVEEAGAAELELVASRSTKEPAVKTRYT